MVVIIDSREPPEYRKLGDTVETLSADAIVSGSVRSYMIERKTPRDIYKSLYDGRLFSQIEYLARSREMGYIPLVAVQGSIWSYGKANDKSDKDIIALQLVSVAYGVPCVYVFGFLGYKMLIEMLKERSEKEAVHKLAIPKKERVVAVEEERVMMLCGIKGVGQKTAEEIIKQYGTIKRMVDEAGGLKEIVGNGKLYRHILEVLGVESNE